MTTLTTTPKPTTLFVQSTANPNPEALKKARGLLSGDSEAMTAFQLTDPTHVTDATKAFLMSRLSAEDAEACAQYLADEALEVARDPEIRSLVTSPRTGRVIRVLRDEDLWQPKSYITKDKDGNESITTPPVRIHPRIEAEIVLGIHDEEREERVTSSLATRIGDAVLRGEYDPRILFATKSGRAKLIEQFEARDIKAMLDRVGGACRVFLDMFDIEYSALGNDACIHNFSTRLGVQDQMTVNPGEFDPLHMLTSSLAASLVRSIAKQALHPRFVLRRTHGLVTEEDIAEVKSLSRVKILDVSPTMIEVLAPTLQNVTGTVLKDSMWGVLPVVNSRHASPPTQWITDPSRSRSLRQSGYHNLLLVEGVDQPVGIGVSAKVGKIRIDPNSLLVNGSERFDSWVVDASIRFEVLVRREELVAFPSQLPELETITLVEGV